MVLFEAFGKEWRINWLFDAKFRDQILYFESGGHEENNKLNGPSFELKFGFIFINQLESCFTQESGLVQLISPSLIGLQKYKKGIYP